MTLDNEAYDMVLHSICCPSQSSFVDPIRRAKQLYKASYDLSNRLAVEDGHLGCPIPVENYDVRSGSCPAWMSGLVSS